MRNSKKITRDWFSSKLAPILLFIVGVLSSASCNRKDADLDGLCEIDSLILVNPQWALQDIRELEDAYESNWNTYAKHRLSLLRCKAENKCGLPHKSDNALDSILLLFAFFNQHRMPHEKFEASYCVACAYDDRDENEESAQWFQASIQLSRSIRLNHADSCTLADVHRRMSEIFKDLKDYENAYKNMRISLDMQKRLGILNFRSYGDMARAAEWAGHTDEASRLYSHCANRLLANNQALQHNALLGEQLAFYLSINDKAHASWLKDIIISLDTATLDENVYTSLASYYERAEQPDSALRFALMALATSQSCISKMRLARQAARLSMQLGHDSLAFHYMDVEAAMSDSVIEGANVQEIREGMIRSLQYELDDAQKKEQHSHTQTNFLFLVCIVMLLLCLVVSLTFFKHAHQDPKRKNGRGKVSCPARSDEPETQPSSSVDERTTSAIHRRRELLVTLEAMEYDSSPHIGHELWNEIYDVVNRLYPDFASTLSSKGMIIEEENLRLLYLVKLGLKKAQIARLTKRSRSHVSRHLHMMD